MRRFRLSIAKSKRSKWAGHRFSWIEAKNWSNCSPYIRTKWECGWMVLEWNTKSGHITIHKKPSLIEKTRTKLNSDYNHWANQIWNRTERAYIYHLHWISYYFFYSFCAMMMIMTVSISSTISCQLEWTYNDRKKNATNNYDRLIFSSSPRYISLCFVMLTEKIVSVNGHFTVKSEEAIIIITMIIVIEHCRYTLFSEAKRERAKQKDYIFRRKKPTKYFNFFCYIHIFFLYRRQPRSKRTVIS